MGPVLGGGVTTTALKPVDMDVARYQDPLTGLLSHTSFHLALRERFEIAEREGQSLGLAMLDLDGFSRFNHSRGHLAGDELLVWLAELVGEEPDLVARMEVIRARVEADSRPVTVSIGLACFPLDARDEKDWFKAADDALYVAKRGGRNQVSLSKPYEERHSKPLVDNDGGVGAYLEPPPSGLSGGGALRFPE